MEQYFKQTQQHADYDAGVMESGDHSTNGANPKSHTSRRNFLLMPDTGDRRKTKKIMNETMKFLSMALMAAIIMFSLSGCSKDDDEDDVSNDSLVGTTWEWTTIDDVFIISFTSKSNLAFSSPGSITSYGAYSYIPPNITLTFIDDGYTWQGIVSDDTITLEMEGSINTFVKK